MKAIRVREDDERSLDWCDTPTPSPSADEVLLKVHATAVNRADLLQRAGFYPPPKGATSILGLEASGTVAAVGDHVVGWELGQRVCALLPGGGYAEYVIVPASMLLPVPPCLDHEQAAAIPEVFYTAFVNLILEAGMKKGDTVVIHAGASGVGTAAIQIAHLWGCRVIASASAPKHERLKALGLSNIIDRGADGLEEHIRDLSDGRGADIILDPVGGAYFKSNVAALAHRGRLVSIGLLGGSSAELDLGRMLRQRLRIIGSVLRTRSQTEKNLITQEFRKTIWPFVQDGTLQPVIDEIRHISDVEQAHARLRSNATFGKVVLQVLDATEKGERKPQP
jgi:putative PIG3 family NAD(P)H quinone oxidoreductase